MLPAKTLKRLYRKAIKLPWYLKIVIVGLISLALLVVFISGNLPSPTKLASKYIPESTKIYDRHGQILYTIYSSKNRTQVPLSQIPKHAQEAAISIEDRSFYRHGAIDLKGIARASYSIVTRKELQGGSTLTQQLVKNSLLTPERTIQRKAKEVLLAFATEALYSKDKILEMYLNQIPYGGTAWGIEAGAQTYFGKKASQLTLGESALLAGLPEAPSVYSPFGTHPELAEARQKEVLRAMEEEGYITREERLKAEKEPLKYKNISRDIKAPHFSLYIKKLLEDKYGQAKVEQGGLKVITSLDLDIQNLAQEAVASEVAKLKGYNVSNGAALVTAPKTGEILAMVGSRDYFDADIDGNVNVTDSERQPGSSIKPINYATGLTRGFTAATVFADQATCFPNQGGKSYCPVNYDGKFRGPVSMRTALANSLNIPAVKMLKANGIENMMRTAQGMGISTWESANQYGLSLTLGGGEVTMLDMATAFGVFANGGYRIDLQPILKVTDNEGKVLEEYKAPSSPIFGTRALPEGVSFIISDILADNNARASAFGTNSPLRIANKPVSVKTGTTNDFKDNWTIGYTPSYVVAAWVGNNDSTPMRGLVSGITGAAPIWHEIMENLLKGKSVERPIKPPNVVQKRVCENGKTGKECAGRFEYFIRGTEGKGPTYIKQKAFIDKTNNQLAKPGQTENVEEKEVTFLIDPTGEKVCISCAPSPTPTPTP